MCYTTLEAIDAPLATDKSDTILAGFGISCSPYDTPAIRTRRRSLVLFQFQRANVDTDPRRFLFASGPDFLGRGRTLVASRWQLLTDGVFGRDTFKFLANKTHKRKKKIELLNYTPRLRNLWKTEVLDGLNNGIAVRLPSQVDANTDSTLKVGCVGCGYYLTCEN